MKIFGYRNRWKVTPGHHPSPQHFPCTVIAWVAVRFAGCGKQVGTAPVRRAVHCQCRSPDDFHHNFKALHVMKCPDIKFQSVSNYTKCTWISFEVVLLRHRLWQAQGEESYIIRKDFYILVIVWEKKRRKVLRVPFFNSVTKSQDWKISLIMHIFSKNSGEELASRNTFPQTVALWNLLVSKILQQ